MDRAVCLWGQMITVPPKLDRRTAERVSARLQEAERNLGALPVAPFTSNRQPMGQS